RLPLHDPARRLLHSQERRADRPRRRRRRRRRHHRRPPPPRPTRPRRSSAPPVRRRPHLPPGHGPGRRTLPHRRDRQAHGRHCPVRRRVPPPPHPRWHHRTRRPRQGPLHHPLRSEEHTSELQSRFDLVCRLLLEKKKADRL